MTHTKVAQPKVTHTKVAQPAAANTKVTQPAAANTKAKPRSKWPEVQVSTELWLAGGDNTEL